MDILNVLSNEELEVLFKALLESNWKVKELEKSVKGNNVKEKIDNWHPASRASLLTFLQIRENENFKFVYHKID